MARMKIWLPPSVAISASSVRHCTNDSARLHGFEKLMTILARCKPQVLPWSRQLEPLSASTSPITRARPHVF